METKIIDNSVMEHGNGTNGAITVIDAATPSTPTVHATVGSLGIPLDSDDMIPPTMVNETTYVTDQVAAEIHHRIPMSLADLKRKKLAEFGRAIRSEVKEAFAAAKVKRQARAARRNGDQ